MITVSRAQCWIIT